MDFIITLLTTSPFILVACSVHLEPCIVTMTGSCDHYVTMRVSPVDQTMTRTLVVAGT